MQSWITPFNVPELEEDFLFFQMSGLMLFLCVLVFIPFNNMYDWS